MNDFYSGPIYMSKAAYYPLMTYIQSLQIDVEDRPKQGNLSAVVDSASLGNTNLNAAKIVIAVIPLLLIIPCCNGTSFPALWWARLRANLYSC